MALPREYAGQACSIAKALEIVGERWTLLIVRDAAYGVRRFSDFVTHLDIPRRVLTERLKFLVEEGILEKQPAGGREEYALTDKGLALFPVIRALAAWGDEYTSPGGAAPDPAARRLRHHPRAHGPLPRVRPLPAGGRHRELAGTGAARPHRRR